MHNHPKAAQKTQHLVKVDSLCECPQLPEPIVIQKILPEQLIHFECPRPMWLHLGEEFLDFEPRPEQLRFAAFDLLTTGRLALQQECCISEMKLQI